MTSTRSVRKVLARAVKVSAHSAYDLTGRSINDLPEYFLSVKVAEEVHKHFKSFTFSMETPMSQLVEETQMDIEGECPSLRLGGKGKVDMVIRGNKSNNVKHIVEFKKHIGVKEIEKDALRLAAICLCTPGGHKAEKNFLVVVTHRNEALLNVRDINIKALISEKFGEGTIKVTFEKIDLSPLKSTKSNGINWPLLGGVWEFKYVG